MTHGFSQLVALLCALFIYALPAHASFHPLEDIRAAAEDFARSSAGHGSEQTIEVGYLDPRLKLRQCPTALETQSLSARNNGRNMTVVVKCLGQQPWTVYVPVKIKTYVEVAIANRPLARGIPIESDAIVFEKREISRLTSGYFEEVASLVNRPPKRTLTKGTIISPRDLGINAVISKGHRVSIVAKTESITVRMPGQALADAGKGEVIRVKNLSSKRTVDAIVLGPGLVQVPM